MIAKARLMYSIATAMFPLVVQQISQVAEGIDVVGVNLEGTAIQFLRTVNVVPLVVQQSSQNVVGLSSLAKADDAVKALDEEIPGREAGAFTTFFFFCNEPSTRLMMDCFFVTFAFSSERTSNTFAPGVGPFALMRAGRSVGAQSPSLIGIVVHWSWRSIC